MAISDPFYDASEPVAANTNLKKVGDGIYVWEDGDLEFMTPAGTVIGPYPVVAGQLIPFRVMQIRTGTTATVSVGTH